MLLLKNRPQTSHSTPKKSWKKKRKRRHTTNQGAQLNLIKKDLHLYQVSKQKTLNLSLNLPKFCLSFQSVIFSAKSSKEPALTSKESRPDLKLKKTNSICKFSSRGFKNISPPSRKESSIARISSDRTKRLSKCSSKLSHKRHMGVMCNKLLRN